MAGVSNGIWRWATLLGAVWLLNAAVTFANIWPTPAVRWSGAVSIELAVCVLFLFAARRWRVRRACGWLAASWVLLALGRYAEVTAPALYGRGVNLYWDGPRLSAVAAMLTRVMSIWILVPLLAAAVGIPVVMYLVFRRAFGRVRTALDRPDEGRALAALAATALLLFAAQQIDARAPAPEFPTPVSEAYVRQTMLLYRGMTSARAGIVGPTPAMRSDLAAVHDADVFLVFIESYGAVSYDRPGLVSTLAASRARFAEDIRATGRGVVSAFVASPTFGGNSWLAHISLLSGIEVRDEAISVALMSQKRDTLVTAFGRQGYRSVAVMPGLHGSWPEGAFYGFDEIYSEARLDYQGPPFGWWSLPDQFAMARMDTLEVARQPRAPVFVFFPTTNTHTPFTPTPPYQPDWARVLTRDPFDSAELQHAWEQQTDWIDLTPSYANALAYTYETIGGYLRLRRDRDFVMILLGDHQPPAAVSGEGASWDVPVHIIASRRAVLDRLMARGFHEGLAAPRQALSGMHTLATTLLEAFGGEAGSAQD